ncbi:MAG: HD-GYP domain-containing protein [Gammaproteobacteria bacterium]|nr:HD-GYP domain-containing protein [Gammaproteobacteria bacterium]
MHVTRMISVEQLVTGMYVAQLDRPWLETPFLFQGFYIRDSDEIKELKAFCKNVYVTEDTLPNDMRPTPPVISIGDSSPPEIPVAPARGRFNLRGLFDLFKRSRPTADFATSTIIYQPSTSLKEEIPAAAGVHRRANVVVKGVMEKVRDSGSLEIENLQEAVTPMVDSVLRNPAALACLMRLQKVDSYLYQHSIASSVWATILGRQLGLNRKDLDTIALGAMVLDVGKTQVPKDLLIKPTKLSDSERDVMHRHIQFGLDILERAGGVEPAVLEMVAHHHERYNGTGYPAGLSGNEIPVFGRIAGIVDTYDAMITRRPYAQQMSNYDALRQLRVLADVEFQAEIVEQFTRAVGVFPTGTLVELNTGEVAVVIKQNNIRRLRPEIMLIMNANKELLDEFRVVDLDKETTASSDHGSIWIETGLAPGTYGIDPTEYYLN